jgi:hypothetical protein
MFRAEEKSNAPNQRTHLLETLLTLGNARRITIEFLTEYCNHSSKPTRISWKDIPILKLKCKGAECDMHIQNNIPNIVFFLIQRITNLPFVKYVSILISLKLPSWRKSHEFIVIIDHQCNISVIPAKRKFSSLDLRKLIKHIKIHTERNSSLQNDEDLMDILFTEKIPLHEFKIRI